METGMDVIKRVFAWTLLIGFIALLANIFVFHYYLKESLVLYAIIAVAFIFLQKRTTF